MWKYGVLKESREDWWGSLKKCVDAWVELGKKKGNMIVFCLFCGVNRPFYSHVSGTNICIHMNLDDFTNGDSPWASRHLKAKSEYFHLCLPPADLSAVMDSPFSPPNTVSTMRDEIYFCNVARRSVWRCVVSRHGISPIPIENVILPFPDPESVSRRSLITCVAKIWNKTHHICQGPVHQSLLDVWASTIVLSHTISPKSHTPFPWSSIIIRA